MLAAQWGKQKGKALPGTPVKNEAERNLSIDPYKSP